MRLMRMAAAVLSLSLAPMARAAPMRPEPLNVMVIDICSARADRFGAYGSKAGLTPALDSFADGAVVFERAWAQASWCLPNYASLLTGHRPEVHGLYANLPFRGLPAWESTVAERMREAGYRTGAFTAGVYTLPAWGLDRGFDAYVNRFSTTAAMPGRFSDLAPAISSWAASGGRPFFVYATVDDLHAPYQTEADAGDASMNVGLYRAFNGEAAPPGSDAAARALAFKSAPGALQALSERYDRSVRAVDRSLGAFFEELKRRGLWDRTLVIVTADHGELLGEHGLLGHTEGLYEPVLRVPLFVRHPGRPGWAGRRVGALVERVDLAPTLLEAAGASADGMELQGRSLFPLMHDPAAPWRRMAYASSKRNLSAASDWEIDERAVRDERWKLIWSRPKGRWELFDLATDPLETRDLSAREPAVLSRLSFELLDLTERARSHATGRPSGREPEPGTRAPLEHRDMH